MSEIRELRRNIDLSQREYATLLGVSLETFRTWDSGRRPVPINALHRARSLTADYPRHTELLPLHQLAAEFGVHVRTLQAAARTGRLDTTFAERSVFGRPQRRASRAAVKRFIATHYRRFAGQRVCPAPLPSVPDNYDDHLRNLRTRLGLSQQALASQIGAASKAVVYQWESRKRTPSPVFWRRIQELTKDV